MQSLSMKTMLVRVPTKTYDGGSRDADISMWRMLNPSQDNIDAFSYYSSQDYRMNSRLYGRDDQVVIRQSNTSDEEETIRRRRRRATTACETRITNNSTTYRRTRVSWEVYPSLVLEM